MELGGYENFFWRLAWWKCVWVDRVHSDELSDMILVKQLDVCGVVGKGVHLEFVGI